MTSPVDRCSVPACKRKAALRWLGWILCDLHWAACCRLTETMTVNEATKMLKLKEEAKP